MQTLGSALDEQKGFAQGFDFLRIVLAASIIGWHTASLSGHVETARGSIFWFSEYMLVPMFFALSGFLVAGSSMRLSTTDFLFNRAARILPALTADIVFAALIIGPLVTTHPEIRYFTDARFFRYFFFIGGNERAARSSTLARWAYAAASIDSAFWLRLFRASAQASGSSSSRRAWGQPAWSFSITSLAHSSGLTPCISQVPNTV